jgi:hypothetical protein
MIEPHLSEIYLFIILYESAFLKIFHKNNISKTSILLKFFFSVPLLNFRAWLLFPLAARAPLGNLAADPLQLRRLAPRGRDRFFTEVIGIF